MDSIKTEDVTRLKSVKSILVSQPKPTDENSPYLKLAEKFNIKVDFRQFIKIEPVSAKDFRKQKINILEHSAIIFTSRNAIDNFFRLTQELRIMDQLSQDLKYFCISDQTANYLQKYITVRKRKVFTGGKNAADLIEIIKKHKSENYLYPCSDVRREDIPEFLHQNGYKFKEMIIYSTVPNDLSDIKELKYDILAFFSPSGVNSLLTNFPNFQQNETRIAAFGATTAKAVLEANLILDIQAPMPNAPSMAGALESYIKKVNLKQMEG